MTEPLPAPALILRLALIALPVVVLAAGLAYVHGLFDPGRLTPALFVDTLQANNGVYAGYRRNHAKGVCVTGWFDSNGQLQGVSRAALFAPGRTPVVGRFALPSGNPYAPDSSVPIRSFALRFTQADGQQWRTGMNSMPVFAVGTPQAFFAMLKAGSPDPATGKPNPDTLKAFFASHPETAGFLAWVKTAHPSASYATERYDGLNAFYVVDTGGKRAAVRWRVTPLGQQAQASQGEGSDYLAQDLEQRLAVGPLRWRLEVAFAAPADPTDDASKAWPAERRTVVAGTVVLNKALAQNEGPCRDINYDPLVLPDGIQASADPLLPARSAAYADSYLRRTREVGALHAHPEARP
ncbi:catalase family peroxidase [Pseudomonas typographi]|uniref:Catalase-related peroxidase n=1 Tax=Pseudomonas typographi TaxID=2715964 RepID=A0ABR7Z9Q6_9PSED|nr:catalase family peroxidase [Pseudomonas typographi]MBD1602189.1 catalase family peroxidase [Pseudomonas typographi]